MAWLRRALALLSLLTAVLSSNPCLSDEPPPSCTTVEVPVRQGDAIAGRICHADCDCPSENPHCVARFGYRFCQP